MKIAQAPKVLLLCLIAGVSWAQTPYDTAVQYAKQLLAQNRLSDAAQASIRAIKMNGSRWEAYALAGIAYAKQNSCEAAIPYFQDALTRAPDQNKGAIQESLGACTTWTDPATGLMWTKKDNGSDITWYQAADYCKNLKLAGYSGWRLPTMMELYGIYDASVAIPGRWANGEPTTWHVKGNLHISGGLWSNTLRGPPDIPVESADLYFFSHGGYLPYPVSSAVTREGSRALCVRSPGN